MRYGGQDTGLNRNGVAVRRLAQNIGHEKWISAPQIAGTRLD